jgi:hypothetical protein
MKKIALIISILIMLSALTSCSGARSSEEKKRTNWSSSNVNDVIQSRIDEENQKSSTDPSAGTTSAASDATTEATTEGTIAPPADGIDVDLTVLSSTMVYSEVYNMMTKPDDYIGKMVKMQGPLACYHDEASGKWYYACIIQDATACCSQGIEFELAGKKAPDDYPSEGEQICVTGVFDTYKEGENTYCTLRNAELG